MTTNKEKFEKLSALIKTKVPSFQNKTKDKSFLFQKILGPVVKLFNKEFLTDYITTLGATVYWPNEASMESDWAWKVLAHEYVHILDNKRNPIGFFTKYGLPQLLAILALGALGAFWSLWCLVCLGFLLCLLPLPSMGRTWAEMRGYTMSMATDEWSGWEVDDVTIEWITGQFTSMAYYRMNPNKVNVQTQLRIRLASIKDKSILIPEENEAFRDVYEMLQEIKNK